jgi:hypothetical protein
VSGVPTAPRRRLGRAAGITSALAIALVAALAGCGRSDEATVVLLDTRPAIVTPTTVRPAPTTPPMTTAPTTVPRTAVAPVADLGAFADAPTPEGFVRYADAAGVVSVAVPAAWRRLTPEQLAEAAATGAAATGSPVSSSAALPAAVLGFSDGRGAAVTVLGNGELPSVAIMQFQLDNAIKMFKATDVVSGPVTIGGTAAVQYDYTMPFGSIVVASRLVLVRVRNQTLSIAVSRLGTGDAELVDRITGLLRFAS